MASLVGLAARSTLRCGGVKESAGALQAPGCASVAPLIAAGECRSFEGPTITLGGYSDDGVETQDKSAAWSDLAAKAEAATKATAAEAASAAEMAAAEKLMRAAEEEVESAEDTTAAATASKVSSQTPSAGADTARSQRVRAYDSARHSHLRALAAHEGAQGDATEAWRAYDAVIEAHCNFESIGEVPGGTRREGGSGSRSGRVDPKANQVQWARFLWDDEEPARNEKEAQWRDQAWYVERTLRTAAMRLQTWRASLCSDTRTGNSANAPKNLRVPASDNPRDMEDWVLCLVEPARNLQFYGSVTRKQYGYGFVSNSGAHSGPEIFFGAHAATDFASLRVGEAVAYDLEVNPDAGKRATQPHVAVNVTQATPFSQLSHTAAAGPIFAACRRCRQLTDETGSPDPFHMVWSTWLTTLKGFRRHYQKQAQRDTGCLPRKNLPKRSEYVRAKDPRVRQGTRAKTAAAMMRYEDMASS